MAELRTSQKNCIEFSVHEVEIAKDKLASCKTLEAVETLIQKSADKFDLLPLNEFGKIRYCSGYNSDTVASVYNHPFFAAVHLAFSQHRPLVFSPDMIWVLILQGLALHVNNNSEKLRHKFVQHTKKAEIVCRSESSFESPESDWELLIKQFSSGLSAALGKNYDDLLPAFSTTGALERTVCQVALMDMFQPYFTYKVHCVCGIPSITLEGKAEDWSLLRQKAELLSNYEFDWWLAELRVILAQFEKAAHGEIDIKFWRNIYKQESRYGSDVINGWIIRLLPYTKSISSGAIDRINPYIGSDFPDLDSDEDDQSSSGSFADKEQLSSDLLPLGLSMVSVEICSSDGLSETLKFYAGFVGIDQDDNSLALRPRLGWAVGETGKRDEFLCNISSTCKLLEAKAGSQYDEAVRKLIYHRRVRDLPADLLSFYRICDGIDFGKNEPDQMKFCSISDLEIINEIEIVESKDVAFCSSHNTEPRESADASLIKAENSDDYIIVNMDPWLKFAEFSDGSYLAIELNDSRVEHTDPALDYRTRVRMSWELEPVYRVCRVNTVTTKAYLLANNFSELIKMAVEFNGQV